VLGIAIGVRHAIDAIVGHPAWAEGPGEQARFCTGNTEDDGITHLVNVTRQEARRELARHAQRLGADGVVLAGQDLNLFHRECPSDGGGRDCCAEVTSIGTAITRFAETAPTAGSPPLAVMSVDPQRRQGSPRQSLPGAPRAPKRALGEDAAVASIDGVQ
jgi:uncharacterized protein YbjQ (UPF0145 family)